MPRKPPLDLSKAAKLEDLSLRSGGAGVQWITAALQTIQSEKLQRITIHPCRSVPALLIMEAVRQEWQDLDRLLVQLWTSCLIRPKIVYATGSGLGGLAPTLLPELTRRGAVDLVEE
jgi:hypothetical protein